MTPGSQPVCGSILGIELDRFVELALRFVDGLPGSEMQIRHAAQIVIVGAENFGRLPPRALDLDALQLRRDLELAEHLDRLGFDEFWCGEHHSTGWEVIASPELFLAAAGERTHTIRLGTGVVSLPYHHPFNVAQRIVQLDHMTRGRVMFGVGPGALVSDAMMMGIPPQAQRDRMDEALGVLVRLMAGEEVTHQSDWFELRQARLHQVGVVRELVLDISERLSELHSQPIARCDFTD